MRINHHAVVIATMIAVLVSNGVVSAQHLVIATSQGTSVEIPSKAITEAYKRIGITIEIQRFPVERSLQMANSGEVDGELIRRGRIEQSYPNLLRVPVAIVTGEIVVVTKNRKFEVKGWESLIPYKVGYVRGVKVVEMNLVEGTCAEAVVTGDQAYRKLDAGRTDVVVDIRRQAQFELKRLGLKDLVVLEPPLLTVPFFHYLHVKNQRLTEPLTKSLQKIKDEGLIQRLYHQAGETVPSSSK